MAPGAGVYTTLDELPDDRYAGVVSVHVVEHLTDDQVAQALACWRRVLRPDGRALVVTPDPAGFGRALAQHAWNGFTDPTHINLKPVSYTHLDVYKRQVGEVSPATSWNETS